MRYFSLCAVLALCHLVDLGAQVPYRKTSQRAKNNQKGPNILFILVDELRYPVVYQSEDLTNWCQENLKNITFLQNNGMNFTHHYAAATACAPSRASLFTGQYITLHGVSQTNGAAKSAQDPTMFWLSPNTVPTLGNIFSTGGYRTFYIGKWHFTQDDIKTPGSQDPVLTFNSVGIPDDGNIRVYQAANVLAPYGFANGWIGPEPHGSSPLLSGESSAIGVAGRDLFYAEEAVSLLNSLSAQVSSNDNPWLMVCSFVNPHDITLYGDLTKNFPTFDFSIDPTLPYIPPSPTASEDLSTKPEAQTSYQEQYQLAFQPTTDTEDYRKLYYSLQKKVDAQIGRVLTALQNTPFVNNTIVVFTSDHGELLGAHGNFQKWFNIYEESIHVPLTFYSPNLVPKGNSDLITSHADIIPTLCGLTNINANAVIAKLQPTFTDARLLVGQNLSNVVLGTATQEQINALNQPVLFLTYDQVCTGQYSTNPTGTPYDYVGQPAFIDAVITTLEGQEGIWKLGMYFEDMDFATAPLPCTCSSPIEPPSGDAVQYEMYNLSTDPTETRNLADPAYSTPETEAIQAQLEVILQEQMNQKALTPGRIAPRRRDLPCPS